MSGQGVEALTDAVRDLGIELVGVLEEIDGDPDAMVTLLADLRSNLSALKQIEASVEAHTARTLMDFCDGKPTEVAGIGTEVKAGSPRTEWDHARMRERIALAVRFDRDTGEEITDDDTARRLVGEALDCCRQGGYKTSALKARGIRYDDCSTTGEGTRRVILTVPEAAPAVELPSITKPEREQVAS